MPKTVEPEEVEETEADRVNDWRRQFFKSVLGSGVGELELDKLVISTASPHDARKLLEQGCPKPLIVDILS